MRIVIAPDSFKESLSAREVCAAIACGIQRVRPEAVIDSIPMADGGEGTVDALVSATGGSLRQSIVTGPLGEPVTATWGLLGPVASSSACTATEPTAVIEMAAASGLALVPPARRNPLLTTTYGTGELLNAALAAGATRIIVGIGGSATTDGGTGAAQALGWRFLDAKGASLTAPITGGQVGAIHRIERGTTPTPGGDRRGAHPLLLVACDVDNPLCGPRGAAAIYGPQKGATPEQVEILDRHLAHLAAVIARDLGRDVRAIAGAGAAGGLGAGLMAFADARLERGIRIVMDAVHFEERIRGADLIITGEGRIDRQSMMGKVIAGVGRAGQAAGVPVIALVGCVGEGADATLEVLHSYHAINPPGTPLAEALAQSSERLATTAMQVMASWN